MTRGDMTRDDLRAFHELDIDFSAIDLDWGGEFVRYFCTPEDAEWVGSIGCDGVHFVLLPEDERVYCVDPWGGEGEMVLPVGENFREFLSFVLYARSATPLTEIRRLDEAGFRRMLEENAERACSDEEWMGELAAKTEAALAAVAGRFGLTPVDPFEKVKAMQEEFDPSILNFSDEYYDVLGLENPRHPGETEVIQGTAFARVILMRGESMLPQDPDILLSYVNTKLRDEYDSLDALCDGLDAVPAELCEKLAEMGYAYDADANQFKPV